MKPTTDKLKLFSCLALSGLMMPLAFAEEQEEVIELDPFEVRAIAEGQRRALQEQRNAANLTNVVAAD
jgi:hypothetical protein